MSVLSTNALLFILQTLPFLPHSNFNSHPHKSSKYSYTKFPSLHLIFLRLKRPSSTKEMASRGIINMGLIAVLLILLCGGATAQSGCTQAIIGMSSCLNYITGNSSAPSSSCCSQLGNVVQSQPQCLCSVLNGGGAALGIAINQTLALALPGACNLQTPSVSQCNAASGPTTSGAATPSSSPSDDSPDIPTTPSESNIPSGSGSGSKTVPSTNGSSSNGSNIKAPLHLVVFVLFILSCASTATRF